jgi:predicted RNase H-like HicB family nuclease
MMKFQIRIALDAEHACIVERAAIPGCANQGAVREAAWENAAGGRAGQRSRRRRLH